MVLLVIAPRLVGSILDRSFSLNTIVHLFIGMCFIKEYIAICFQH